MLAHVTFPKWLNRARDALVPPRCLGCHQLSQQDGSLCSSCWQHVIFLPNGCCNICGLPFPYSGMAAELECGACAAQRPYFDRARAAIAYAGVGRNLLLRFKHSNYLAARLLFARWLNSIMPSLSESIDCVIPVPLHWRRLFYRGYNQAAILAQDIARANELLYTPDLLRRRRHTPLQGHKSKPQRIANVKRAFQVAKGSQQWVRDKKILIVDDVMTSGATVNEAARILKQAGAAQVQVLCVARVVKEA